MSREREHGIKVKEKLLEVEVSTDIQELYVIVSEVI